MGIRNVRRMITLFFMSTVLLSFSALPAQTQDMMIDDNGNVGIGTTEPFSKLQVYGGDIAIDSDKVIRFRRTWYGDTTGTPILGHSGHAYTFLRPIDYDAGDGVAIQQYDGTTIAYFMQGGNVGIGTTNPTRLLRVEGDIYSTSRIIIGNSGSDDPKLQMFMNGATMWLGTVAADDIAILTGDSTERIRIKANTGNIGIGTTTPDEKLQVSGNAHVTGNMQVDGNIAAKYQDLAEYVRTSESLTRGMVVMIDTKEVNQVVPSDRAYNTLVAGVVSETPGIILGEGGADKAIIAHTGRVKVKVDTSSGEISVGDLLVTSPVKGHAMKADTDKLKPGMLLGKALEPLNEGQQDEILVLITLQ